MLPRRVRYPVALGEQHFAIRAAVGTSQVLLKRLWVLSELIESWARNWEPSLCLSASQRLDFEDWMVWGTGMVADVF
eukprot:3884345-Pyramimonas_sp.AAC.1